MSSSSPISGEGGARREAVGGRGPAYPTRKELLARAKWMRAHPTEAEKRLWSALRAKRLEQYKFKRQQVIEPYIVDFVCFGCRLIVEADGSQHSDNKHDERRDAFLRANGFQMLRFWNNDVLRDREAVIIALLDALAPSPSQACGLGPSLSRKGRGASGAPHA